MKLTSACKKQIYCTAHRQQMSNTQSHTSAELNADDYCTDGSITPARHIASGWSDEVTWPCGLSCILIHLRLERSELACRTRVALERAWPPGLGNLGLVWPLYLTLVVCAKLWSTATMYNNVHVKRFMEIQLRLNIIDKDWTKMSQELSEIITSDVRRLGLFYSVELDEFELIML